MKKKVQNKRNNRLFTIVTILLLFIFSLSVFMVGKELIQSKKEQDAFKDLTTIVEQGNNKNDNDNTNTEELKPNYDELYHMNNDFIGWLSIPNTKVDYPLCIHQMNQSIIYVEDLIKHISRVEHHLLVKTVR